MKKSKKKKKFPNPDKRHIVEFKWPIRVHAVGATTPKEAIDQVDAAMGGIIEAIESDRGMRSRRWAPGREIWVGGKPFIIDTEGLGELPTAARTVYVLNTNDYDDSTFVRVKR